MNDKKLTRFISKKIITQNDCTESTFKGEHVLNCSINPRGVVKAQINETKGVVSFTKYDPDWMGEVTLNITSKDDSMHYVNDYTVQFGG